MGTTATAQRSGGVVEGVAAHHAPRHVVDGRAADGPAATGPSWPWSPPGTPAGRPRPRSLRPPVPPPVGRPAGSPGPPALARLVARIQAPILQSVGVHGPDAHPKPPRAPARHHVRHNGLLGAGPGRRRQPRPRLLSDDRRPAAPGARRRGEFVDEDARTSPSGHGAWPSSTCRRRATSPWPRPTGATSSPSTARSTTSPSCARELEAGRPRFAGTSDTEVLVAAVQHWGLRGHPRRAATACSPSRCGTAAPDAAPGARPVRGEAALLRLGRHHLRCSGPS